MMSNNTLSKERLLTFYLNGNLFGLDITVVKEINRNFEFTAVADSPAHIIGLLNMRGQVVTLFDLAMLLGFEKNSQQTKSSCVILKNNTAHPDFTGFLIDQSGSAIDVEENSCENAPANINQVDNKLLAKVVKLDGELVMVIDHKVLFEQY